MIQLPIPDKYEYIDVDKIITMDFDAYEGKLTIDFGESCKAYWDNAKRILDKIIEATACQDGIPKIPKREKPQVNEITIHEVEDLCDLIT